MTIQILPKPFDPEAELAAFRRRCAGAGAIASFIGCVRQDPGVRALILEDYPALTEPSIREFAERAVERFALEGVAIVHRVGEMDPGEPIVFVACASAHRRLGQAAKSGMQNTDRTKGAATTAGAKINARGRIAPPI